MSASCFANSGSTTMCARPLPRSIASLQESDNAAATISVVSDSNERRGKGIAEVLEGVYAAGTMRGRASGVNSRIVCEFLQCQPSRAPALRDGRLLRVGIGVESVERAQQCQS